MAWENKVDACVAFIDGAKEGFKVTMMIVPNLVGSVILIPLKLYF